MEGSVPAGTNARLSPMRPATVEIRTARQSPVGRMLLAKSSMPAQVFFTPSQLAPTDQHSVAPRLRIRNTRTPAIGAKIANS